jgi:hypothetical protein
VAQVSGITHEWVWVDTTGGCDPAPSLREILEAGHWTDCTSSGTRGDACTKSKYASISKGVHAPRSTQFLDIISSKFFERYSHECLWRKLLQAWLAHWSREGASMECHSKRPAAKDLMERAEHAQVGLGREESGGWLYDKAVWCGRRPQFSRLSREGTQPGGCVLCKETKKTREGGQSRQSGGESDRIYCRNIKCLSIQPIPTPNTKSSLKSPLHVVLRCVHSASSLLLSLPAISYGWIIVPVPNHTLLGIQLSCTNLQRHAWLQQPPDLLRCTLSIREKSQSQSQSCPS